MTRTDSHMDAMLRHLGAAYYESLHGRASAADVARARTAIEERMAEQPDATDRPRDGKDQGRTPAGTHHHGRWHTRVRDVMTTKVVAVDRITSYKEIARLLSENKISAVPVLIMGRHVVGVVSEADLLAAQDQAARRARSGRTVLPWRAARHPKLTAEQLMTRPAITIHPDAPIARAAALMHTHHVKRLPVVDPQGKLTGIVSRRDLLSVFLRPDAQIAAEVRELLKEILFADPETISVAVHGGVVTLRGQPGPQDHHDLIPVALRLIWDIDGVIDVVNKISTEAAPPAAPSAPGDAADAEETYTKRGQGGEAVAGSRVGAAGCSPGAPCARLRAYRLVRRPHQPRGHGNVDRACGCGPTSNDLATRVHGRAPAFGEGESSEGT